MLTGMLSDRVEMRDLSLFFLQGTKDSLKGDYRFVSTRKRMAGCLRRAAFSLPDDLYESKLQYNEIGVNTAALLESAFHALIDAEENFTRLREIIAQKYPITTLNLNDSDQEEVVRNELLEIEAALLIHRVKIMARTTVSMYVESQLQGFKGKQPMGQPTFAHAVAISLRHGTLTKSGMYISQLARLCVERNGTFERAIAIEEGKFGLGASKRREDHAIDAGLATAESYAEPYSRYGGGHERSATMVQLEGSQYGVRGYRTTLVRLGVLKVLAKSLIHFPKRPEVAQDIILAISVLQKRSPREEFRANGEHTFYSAQDVLMRAFGGVVYDGCGIFDRDRDSDKREQFAAALQTIRRFAEEDVAQIEQRSELITWVNPNDNTHPYPPPFDSAGRKPKRVELRRTRMWVLEGGGG